MIDDEKRTSTADIWTKIGTIVAILTFIFGSGIVYKMCSADKTTENKEDTDERSSVIQRIPSVGDTIFFGSYEQDHVDNGTEAIEWYVLSVDGTKVLLLSKYGLERQKFVKNEREATWETSDLRIWLNGFFYQNAFSASEQKRIVKRTNSSDRNPKYPDVYPGADTKDFVFILSYSEATMYQVEIKCKPTKQLVYLGALVNDGGCWWWMRTPGKDAYNMMGGTTIGDYHYSGSEIYDYGSVRPAILVDFSG